jgi:hypothetical protein
MVLFFNLWEPLTPLRGVIEQGQSEPTLRGKMLTRLLRDHLARDWRDIIPTIKIPTMILMGGCQSFRFTIALELVTRQY